MKPNLIVKINYGKCVCSHDKMSTLSLITCFTGDLQIIIF